MAHDTPHPAAEVKPPDGYTIKARPTTYKGIPMRSRLEASYAAHLDQLGRPWWYEPRCFADDEYQYLPDFLIYDADATHNHHNVYVECKPFLDADSLPVLQRRMETIWASEPDAALILWFATGELYASHSDDAAWARCR